MSVVPNFKPEPEPCPCGCGVLGVPTKKGHVRNCDRKRCASCRNRGNRKSGLRKQNDVRKALGIAPAGQHEERWSDAFANEVKSGDQCGPLWTWWSKVEKQVRANEPDYGNRKPVRAIAMPTGTRRGLVVVELATWETLVAPALEEFYGPEGVA